MQLHAKALPQAVSSLRAFEAPLVSVESLEQLVAARRVLAPLESERLPVLQERLVESVLALPGPAQALQVWFRLESAQLQWEARAEEVPRQ